MEQFRMDFALTEQALKKRKWQEWIWPGIIITERGLKVYQSQGSSQYLVFLPTPQQDASSL